MVHSVGLPDNWVSLLATTLPVLASLLLSFQGKFRWDEKAEVSKESQLLVTCQPKTYQLHIHFYN